MTTFTPQLIALDLDGTLLGSDLKVSERTHDAIQKLKTQGIQIVLCTGRPPRYTREIAAKLGLSETVIVYNGASIHNFEAGTAQHLHQLAPDTAAQVVTAVRQTHPEVSALIETTKGWFIDEALYLKNISNIEKNGVLPDGHGDVLEFLTYGAIKVLFRHPELEAATLAQPLAELDVYTTWSHSSLLEVQHKSVNKRAALIHLCQTLNLDSSQVAAFGDQNNDIEMLTWAGYGVAMGNACDAAKQAADFVTLSNDENGVAEVLERWL